MNIHTGCHRHHVAQFVMASVAALLLLCSACTISPQASVDNITLSDDQAIIGLVTASLHTIREFDLKGSSIHLLARHSIGARANLLLFKARAGRYCLEEVSLSHTRIDLSQYTHNCFYAIAGTIGYIGHYLFTPEASPKTHAFDKFDEFKAQLKKIYPGLLGKYRSTDLIRTYTARRHNLNRSIYHAHREAPQ